MADKTKLKKILARAGRQESRNSSNFTSSRSALVDVDKYIFFWRTNTEHGYMSQWYISDFVDPQTKMTFNCCEQYMMYNKAKLFNDRDVMQNVMETAKPMDQKKLGRQVKNFNEQQWDTAKYGIVVEANKLKFSRATAQSDEKCENRAILKSADNQTDEAKKMHLVPLRELLLRTGDKDLVEASPFDQIWGIGLGAAKASTTPPAKWGQNLLGKALMDVRAWLRQQESEEKKQDEADNDSGL